MKAKPPKVSIFSLLKLTPSLVRNPIPIILGWKKELGNTFRIENGFSSSYVISEPEHIQRVLQKNNKNYRKSKLQTEHLAKYIGQGLLTSEGAYWLKQRRLIQPEFHRQKLAGLSKIMLQETNRYLDGLEVRVKRGAVIDIASEMMTLTSRIVAKSLFSTSLSDEDLERVGYIIGEVQHYFVKTIRVPIIKPWLYLSGEARRIRRLIEEGDGILMGAIEERRRNGLKCDDLLDILLHSRYEDTGEGMNNQQIRDEAMILFVAGHETSANALSWAFYLLSSHPEIENKTLTHLEQVLGEKEIGFEHLRALGYLRQVIDETMRLYPPAWVTDRMAIDEDEFGEYRIPRGALIMPFIYGVHHDESIWPQAETFDPDRFSPERAKDIPKFAYLPFGGGPRQCIGNNFAIYEMMIVITQMLKRFKMELVEEQVIDIEPLVTLRPRYGIKMHISKRV